MKNVAGIIAMSIYASESVGPFYTGSSKWHNDGKFDPNEIKKSRKKCIRKKK